MKPSFRAILFTLIACSLSTLAVADESAPSAASKPAPSLLSGAPLNVLTPPQKTPEASTTQKNMRMGYIDLMKVNSDTEIGKSGLKQLEEKKKKFQTQVEAKRKQLEKLKSAIEAKIQSMTPQQREAKAKEFQKKVEEFQKFGLNSENELQALQQEIVTSLYEKVEQACSEYGKANGLALVIVKRELLYLDNGVEAVDVTDGVVNILNKKELKK
jgi:outer membrane protein